MPTSGYTVTMVEGEWRMEEEEKTEGGEEAEERGRGRERCSSNFHSEEPISDGHRKEEDRACHGII